MEDPFVLCHSCGKSDTLRMFWFWLSVGVFFIRPERLACSGKAEFNLADKVSCDLNVSDFLRVCVYIAI